MLSSIYRYADLVYIGGGFNKSVHNVLEPAAHGKAMIFGPNHHKSNEAKELVVMGIASIVNSNENIATTALTIMNGNIENQKGNQAKEYVKSKTGGTEKIISNCSI
jgi:3-deoxy-D-manno-octulosonic-acid transferase